MSDEKRVAEQPSAAGEDDKQKTNSASRARNRTVMLTPEMTGQVRALLQRTDDAPAEDERDPLAEFLPPLEQGAAEEAHGGGGNGQSFGSDTVSPTAGLADSGKRTPTGKLSRSAVDAARETAPAPSGGQPGFSVNPTAEAAPAARPVPKSKVVAFFVSYDKEENGEVYDIHAGRWLLTSRPTEHGDYILVNDETISPLHAIIRATKDGKLQVLDQLSEFGTGVLRAGETDEQEVAGSMIDVAHGDTIRFGERFFVVCLIPAVQKKSD